MPTMLDPFTNTTNSVQAAAARRRAEEDALLASRTQATAASTAEAQRQATDAENKRLGSTMKVDALQWTADPQYQKQWGAAPQEARQHFIDAYGSNAEKAPEAWNSSVAQNKGTIPGLENLAPGSSATLSPTGEVTRHFAGKEPISSTASAAASRMGIKVTPDMTPADLQIAMAEKAQQTEDAKAATAAAKQQTQQDKTSITEWQKLVRQNPTAQTVARNLSTAERNLQSIEDNSKGPVTPAMQNNILTAYMGIEKPGVSPTDQDRKAALNTAGVWSDVGRHIGNVFSNRGDIMTPGQINQMRAAARLTVDSYRKEYAKHVSSAVHEALNRGLDPNTVIAPGIYDPVTKQIRAPRDPNSVFGEGDVSLGDVPPGNGSTGEGNITREAYEALPSGSTYTWNGKQLKKK